MEPNDMLVADPLDILFDNRNKSYGAYTLRKYYVQRMYIAMGFTLSLAAVISFLILHFQNIPATVRAFDLPDKIIGTFEISPPVRPFSPARPASVRPVATQTFITPVITHQITDVKPMATVAQLNTAVIGTTTVAGPPDDGAQHNGTAATGMGISTKIDSAQNKNEVLKWAEQMPEFPGGSEALKRYLLKNLRMPDNNLETGASIQVVARFVVGADGKVRDIEIVQTAEDVFNREVNRVISKMPDWKPGMQNHHPVAVYFNLPVNFLNQE
jgi:periplasmic protein TonB